MVRNGQPVSMSSALSNFKKEIKPTKQQTMFSKTHMWNAFKKHSIENYVIDSMTEKMIVTLMRYFRGDENFNEHGLITSKPGLRKGFLIFGNHGVGKTLLFDTIHAAGNELYLEKGFRKMRFKSISCVELVNSYQRAVKGQIDNFNIEDFWNRLLYLDDLGYEPKAFGKTELLGELLYMRNRNKAVTFITTNKTPNEIAERYGSLIGDRLDEDFNIIKWSGETMRE